MTRRLRCDMTSHISGTNDRRFQNVSAAGQHFASHRLPVEEKEQSVVSFGERQNVLCPIDTV